MTYKGKHKGKDRDGVLILTGAKGILRHGV